MTGLLLLLLSQLDHLGDSTPRWRDCPYGQQLIAQSCSGNAVVMDMRTAKQLLLTQADNSSSKWRLPTANELKSYPRERLQLSEYQVLSSEHIAHGNEFMVITLNPQNGKLEYQPLHYSGLIVFIRDQ